MTQPSLIDIDLDDNELSVETDSQLARRLHEQWNGYNDDTSQTRYYLLTIFIGCVANCMYDSSGKVNPKNPFEISRPRKMDIISVILAMDMGRSVSIVTHAEVHFVVRAGKGKHRTRRIARDQAQYLMRRQGKLSHWRRSRGRLGNTMSVML